MRRVLEKALPLVEVLWEREWKSGEWSTPERRALLDKQIATLLGRIGDVSVRQHYSRALRAKLNEAWAPWPVAGGGVARPGGYATGRSIRPGLGSRSFGQHGKPAGGRPFLPKPRPSASLRKSALVGQADGSASYREALLLRALINHPWLLDEHAERIAQIDFSLPLLGRLRDAILSLKSHDISLDSRSLRTQLEEHSLRQAIDSVERAITHRSDRFAEPDAEDAEVEAGFNDALALHDRQKGLKAALENAEHDFLVEGSEESLARLCEVQRLIASLDVVETSVEL